MRLLLDTGVIVSWSLFPERLRAETRAAIASPDNEVFLSATSVWDINLRIAKQKLSLPANFAARLLADGFEELPFTIAHAACAAQLPVLHADPIDRLLIAQALTEGLMLVTNDPEIVRYDVPVMDA